MSEIYTLHGEYSTKPSVGYASGQPSCQAPISESLGLTRSLHTGLTLSADGAQAVDFGGLTNVNVLHIKTTGGKVTATITSADGASQAIPVDSVLALITLSVPITALSLTRVAGVTTQVTVFLGER